VTCQLTVTDCFGNAVQLEHSNWQKHLTKRPELAAHHDHLGHTLSAPALVIEATRDGHYHFYRRHFPTLQLRTLWLRVVVAYYPTEGKIQTAWLSTRVDRRGVQRWPIP
jgi:hypothetical protein